MIKDTKVDLWPPCTHAHMCINTHLCIYMDRYRRAAGIKIAKDD